MKYFISVFIFDLSENLYMVKLLRSIQYTENPSYYRLSQSPQSNIFLYTTIKKFGAIDPFHQSTPL